jgi:hypothetical protein
VIMGRPSLEALAMAGVDWEDAVRAGVVVDDEEGAPPPEHLLEFEAFLEEAVPADMILAFELKEAARAQCGKHRRSPEEDVKEKLKLWAKAVARKASEEQTTALSSPYTTTWKVSGQKELLSTERTRMKKGNGLEQGKQGKSRSYTKTGP